MAPTTTVRVHAKTREALARLSEQHGLSTADLLAEIVERRLEDALLERMNASFSKQRSDRRAWAAEQSERASWDATLLDGLTET